MAKASPALVEGCLRSLDFPVDKEELLRYAKQKCSKQENVVDTISSLPDQQYNSPIDVTKAMKNMDQ